MKGRGRQRENDFMLKLFPLKECLSENCSRTLLAEVKWDEKQTWKSRWETRALHLHLTGAVCGREPLLCPEQRPLICHCCTHISSMQFWCELIKTKCFFSFLSDEVYLKQMNTSCYRYPQISATHFNSFSVLKPKLGTCKLCIISQRHKPHPSKQVSFSHKSRNCSFSWLILIPFLKALMEKQRIYYQKPKWNT